MGRGVIEVPRKEDHPLRQARLAARATTVQLRPPAHRRAEGLNPATIGGVLAQEIGPPEGESPIRWLLLTTLPVETLSEAQQIVQWYTFRWRIERLHVVLKTGGSTVEKLPLETFARLQRAIAFYSVIAWCIRQRNRAPCGCCMSANPREGSCAAPRVGCEPCQPRSDPQGTRYQSVG